MSINRRTLEELLRQRKALAAITDAAERDLIEAWVKSWDRSKHGLLAELEKLAVDPGRIGSQIRTRKVIAALGGMSHEILSLGQAAGVRISGEARSMLWRAIADQDVLIRTQLPTSVGINLHRVDPRQIGAMARRTTEQIHSRTWALSDEAVAAMRHELVYGITVGDNPRATARHMLKQAQGAFNGGLARAMVISRTESLDAYRTAAQAQQDANSDTLAGWQWHANLSNRTCASCIAQHGNIYPLDEPGPNDHQQGRCARVPVTKTWRELGIDIPEPPGRVEPGDGIKWLESQPEDVQKSVLGPKRWEAWKDGQFNPDEWSSRRVTPGWRDSFAVGKLR